MRRGKSYRKPRHFMSDPNLTQEEKHRILHDPKFKGCEVKIPFTKEEAEAVVERAGVSKSGYKRLSIYKCRYCPMYHCTSKQRRKI